MLLPIRPVCSSTKARRDGTSIIFIQYCYSSTNKTLLNTGLAIPASFWAKKLCRVSRELPAKYGNHQEINKEIQREVRLAEDIISYALEIKAPNPVEFARVTFRPDFSLQELNKSIDQIEIREKQNLDFFFQLENYIQSKGRTVSPKMINVFRNLRDTLKVFETFRKEPITFDSINFNFYEEFKDYMLHEHIHRRRKGLIKGFRVSTVGRTIKQLRIFLRNRMRKNIIPQINLEDFKIIDEESDAIYLTNEEVLKIYHVDLTSQTFLEKYRDLFVVGCLTGLRFSDFSKIRPEDIRNKMLYKKQVKSDSWVVIPLKDIADYILNYKFERKIIDIDNAVFNQYIKEIGKIAGINELITFSHKKANKTITIAKPKYEWITSHTCRRSFCTNEFLSGTPAELIMRISGHKNLRDFYKYIRITPEEAGRKIKEIWEKRGEISTPTRCY